MITVQQVVFTGHPERWHALAAALELVAPYPPEPDWAEFDGDGVLAVHRAGVEHPAGRVDLNLLVDDLDAAQHALREHNVERGDMTGVGEYLTVRAESGVGIAVFGGARAAHGDVAVQPIWFQDDVDEARAILEALGMRATVAADGGGWVDLRADGGGAVGVHSASGRAEGSGSGIGLSFESRTKLGTLAERVTDAGFTASVIDESYSRTLRIIDPDGGPDVWVNEVQQDLYGYHRVT